jgi:hypothetical protein
LWRRGDAADVRGLLRQHVMAAALQDAGAQQAIGGNKTLCTAPTSFLYTQAGGCNVSQTAIYVLLTDAPYTNMFAQVCGTSCQYKDTVPYPANVGGVNCAGNKKVDIAIAGVMSTMLSDTGACTPCSDVQISTAPQDSANLMACGITDMMFSSMVSGTVALGNTIAVGTVNLSQDIASGTVNLGNTIATGTVNLGNTIAKGTIDVTKSIGKLFGR